MNSVESDARPHAVSATAKRPYRMTLRAAAAERTSHAIVEAALARLLDDHYDDITLAQIADGANVTVQTVLRKFGSKDGVISAVFEAGGDSGGDYRDDVPRGDAEAVVDRVVEQYEYFGDALIRLLAVEGRIAVVGDQMNRGRRDHRDWLERVFTQTLPSRKSARTRRLAQIVVATDVYTWKICRRDLSMSVPETKRAMTDMLHRVLETAGEHRREGAS